MALIFYKNKKKHKKVEEKNIVFSIFDDGIVTGVDDLVSKPVECKSFYNLSYNEGALKTGLGFRDLQVPASDENLTDCHSFDFSTKIDEICGVWMDRWFNNDYGKYAYQLIMSDSTHYLWGVPLIDSYNGHIWTKSDDLVSAPLNQCNYRINNQDCCLFFTAEGMLYLAPYALRFEDKVPPLISCVVHYDNFFGITNTNRNTLIYTKNLNLLNWTDEDSSAIEFLDNRGSFTKLVTLDDYVYLFREYGITKISIYTTKSDFSFNHLYISTSKIYEDSICVCGNKILFMTRDGLYSFNGNSVSQIVENYNLMFRQLDNNKCTSACLNGKYYLATKCDFDDEQTVGCENGIYVNNVLFEIDVEDFSLNLYRGVDIRKLLSVDNPYMSKLCACFYNEHKQRIGELTCDGSTFENANAKCWTSFKTDLGFKSKKKKIKEIIINTLYDCEVVISSDCETKSYHIYGDDKEQRILACVSGKNFQFSFKTNAPKCEIKKPMVVFALAS